MLKAKICRKWPLLEMFPTVLAKSAYLLPHESIVIYSTKKNKKKVCL